MRGDYLDVGAGNGELIDRVMREFKVKVRACDYRDDLMTIGDLKVDVVDLNTGALPYPNESFDLVTCTEVIEHLEHFRSAFREISRVLRPGGIFVVSTPNVLNLRSRLRYLLFGFFNMFGPLQLDDDRYHSTHGHINPVGYFYLAHALHWRWFHRHQSVGRQTAARFVDLRSPFFGCPFAFTERGRCEKSAQKYQHSTSATNHSLGK